MANYNILKAAPEDLPDTWTSVKNDVEGTGVDVKVSLTNRPYVSYLDGDNVVKVLYSADVGATWSTPVIVEADVEDCQTGIAFDQLNRPYVFFAKDFSGTVRIAYRMSLDAGNTWSELKDTGIEI